jgi:predicted RNA polymerase sigma factor
LVAERQKVCQNGFDMHEPLAMQPKTPRELVAAFGGRTAVAEITGASRNSVSNWYRDGIPAKFYNCLVKAARERKVDGITHDGLEAANVLVSQSNPKRIDIV